MTKYGTAFKRKRSSSRRPFKRRRVRKASRRLRIPRPLIIPKRKTVIFRWTKAFALDPVAGAVDSLVWQANAMNPLGGVAAGDWPPGADQWAVFYSTYEIKSSTCRVELYPRAANVSDSLFQATLQSNGSGSALTIGQLIAARGLPNTSFVTSHLGAGNAGPNNGKLILNQSFNLRRNFGHGPNSDTEAGLGNVTTPSEAWYFVLTVGNPWDLAENPTKVHYTVSITMVAQLRERKLDLFDAA